MKTPLISRFSAFVWLAVVPAAFAQDCGCGITQQPGNNPNPVVPAPQGETKVITLADKDKTVALKTGDRLEVRLESNPSTGYEWVVAFTNAEVLPQVGESKFETPKTDQQGAPTIQILTFDAKKAGTVKLELHYKRPWEKEAAPIKTFAATAEIS